MDIDPLLTATFTAVENATAINMDVANRPNAAVTALTSLQMALTGHALPGDILANLTGAIANVTSSQASVSNQIGSQLTNLLPNIQTYQQLNEVRVATGEISQNDVGSDINDYFGSIMMPQMIIKIANRRVSRLTGTGDDGTQEAITDDTIPTIRDEVSQISGYATQLTTQSTTEPAALTAAFQRLNSLTTAAVLLDYLQVPETFPILDIVAGAGFKPVVDAVKYQQAVALGMDGMIPPDVDPDNPVYPDDLEEAYANIAASAEPTPPSNTADPVPPPVT